MNEEGRGGTKNSRIGQGKEKMTKDDAALALAHKRARENAESVRIRTRSMVVSSSSPNPSGEFWGRGK